MFETIQQHFTWNNMFQDIANLVCACPTCQRYKKQRKQYGHLPPVQHQPHSWNTVAVDLIGPWTIQQPIRHTVSNSSIQLLVLSMIDPDTYWT
jgi:hypothetical protein